MTNKKNQKLGSKANETTNFASKCTQLDSKSPLKPLPKPLHLIDFDAWLDAELEKLEIRFADWTTANSRKHHLGR